MICRVCELPKDPSQMKKSYGKPCKICCECDGKKRADNYKKTPKSKARRDRILAKRKEWRKNGVNVDQSILTQSRSNDKRKGRDNDLTREFIRTEIIKCCTYCGDMTSRMTLDRIDNSIGHIQTNVVPACLRCNYVRRDIPFEAWLIIAPAVKEARERGAFGTWNGSWLKPGK